MPQTAGHTPADFEFVVGQTFVKKATGVLVDLGSYKLTRYDLGRLGCPHPVAANEVNRVLKQLDITTPARLKKQFSYERFSSLKGIGVTAFYVLLCILDDLGENTAELIREEAGDGKVRTFATVKSAGKKSRRKLRKQLETQ